MLHKFNYAMAKICVELRINRDPDESVDEHGLCKFMIKVVETSTASRHSAHTAVIMAHGDLNDEKKYENLSHSYTYIRYGTLMKP